MKLMVKKEFFDQIKDGLKKVDYRDAHITFVCEENNEKLVKRVVTIFLVNRFQLPEELRNRSDLFKDDLQIGFVLGDLQ